MQLTITFSLVRCACGAERQAGRRCPDCGREPEEIDEDLARRQAIVAGVTELEPVGEVEPLVLEEAIEVVGAWLERFFAAYEATAEGSVEGAAKRLRESLQELDVLHERASGARRLRPNYALWAAIDGVLGACNDVRSTYLDTLLATPDWPLAGAR